MTSAKANRIYVKLPVDRNLSARQTENCPSDGSGLQDRYLHDYTFANDKGYNPEIKKAQRYVTEWAMMKENCIGLLLWGNVGTGKTFIAACIANALIEKGVSVLMTNFSKILNSLSAMFDVDRNKFIESFNRYSQLIIDDLGRYLPCLMLTATNSSKASTATAC